MAWMGSEVAETGWHTLLPDLHSCSYATADPSAQHAAHNGWSIYTCHCL